MLCFQALGQIIWLFMYFYYFQNSRNVMFSGTVLDYLFIYVFLLFPEVQKCFFSGTVSDYLFIYVFLLFPESQKCYVFWHCARLFIYFYYFQKCYVFWHCVRLFVYLCISITSRSPEMLFRLFVYLCIPISSRSPEMLFFQALCQIICLFMYLYYLQKSRNVMFSWTVPDYLFIYVFLLFPEVQKCYVFWHCVRLFVYLCISIISRSPEML